VFQPGQYGETDVNSSCPSKPISLSALWVLLLVCGFLLQASAPAHAQEETRKIKHKVAAQYPELARKNNMQGSVRVQITVTPEGKVKDPKVLGGNPVLVDAFIQALKQWEYEPGPRSTTVVVVGEFKSPS
jgi:TonB family protein